jgi:hypothetical protein
MRVLRLALLKVGLTWSETLEIGQEEALVLIDDFIERGKPRPPEQEGIVRKVATRRLNKALAKKPR